MIDDRQESGYSAALLSIDGSAVAALDEPETAEETRVRGGHVLSRCAIISGPASVFEDGRGSASPHRYPTLSSIHLALQGAIRQLADMIALLSPRSSAIAIEEELSRFSVSYITGWPHETAVALKPPGVQLERSVV